MKIFPVGSKLFYVDGRTDEQPDNQRDTTELTVAFRHVTKAPKRNESRIYQ